MHRAVLAYLEIDEVKAKGLHLPDELVQLAIRLPRRAGRRERILEAAEIIEQLARPRISNRQVGATGCADTLGDEQEELPVRLSRGAFLDGCGASADDVPRRAEAAEEARRGRRGRGIGGQGGADAGGGRLQPAEDVLRLDEHRLARHLGGDLRISVAITADPASESQKGRRGRQLHARGDTVEPGAELPVDGRDQSEEGLVEDAHEGANLIERLQLLAAQLGGAPETVDLLQQPPSGLRLRRLRCPRSVQPIELLAHPSKDRGHGASTRFGGMRGEYRVHAKCRKQSVQALVSELRAHRVKGGCEPFRRTGRIEVGLPQRASAIPLFGQVDEVEIAGERTRDLLGTVE